MYQHLRKNWCKCFVAGGLLKLLVAVVLSRHLLSPSQRSAHDDSIHASTSPYPTSIPRTRRRRDIDGSPVERGRLQKLGGVSPFVLGRHFLNTTKPVLSVIGAATNSSASKLTRAFRWRKMKGQVKLQEFQKQLQCAQHEPDLDGSRGTLALAKLVPVTAQSLRVVAAYIESEQRCSPWVQCARLAKYLAHKFARMNPTTKREEPYNEDGDSAVSQNDRPLFVKVFKKIQFAPIDDRTRMLRVLDGVLYVDWPWGEWRWKKQSIDFFALRLFGGVLEMVANMPDCVFYMRNYDYPLFHDFVPVPAFSHAPSNAHSDIPFPWVRAVDDEINYYQDQLVSKEKVLYKELFFDDGYTLGGKELEKNRRLAATGEGEEVLLRTTGSGITGTKVDVLDSRPVHEGGAENPPLKVVGVATATRDEARSLADWAAKQEKGVFYGYLWGSQSATARMVALDLARLYPEYLDVEWTSSFLVQPYSPLSTEEVQRDAKALLTLHSKSATGGKEVDAKEAGWLRNYSPLRQKTKKEPKEYVSGHKYLLVLSGNNGADRLGEIQICLWLFAHFMPNLLTSPLHPLLYASRLSGPLGGSHSAARERRPLSLLREAETVGALRAHRPLWRGHCRQDQVAPRKRRHGLPARQKRLLLRPVFSAARGSLLPRRAQSGGDSPSGAALCQARIRPLSSLSVKVHVGEVSTCISRVCSDVYWCFLPYIRCCQRSSLFMHSSRKVYAVYVCCQGGGVEPSL